MPYHKFVIICQFLLVTVPAPRLRPQTVQPYNNFALGDYGAPVPLQILCRVAHETPQYSEGNGRPASVRLPIASSGGGASGGREQ